MATRLQWRTHNDFSKGVMRDVPAYKLPEGYVWEAMNVLITREGSLQKRGAISMHHVTSSLSGFTYFRSIGHASGVANTKNLLYASAASATARVWSCGAGDVKPPIYPSAAGFDTEARAASVGVPANYSGQAIFPLDGNNTLQTGYPSPFFSGGGVDFSLTTPPAQGTSGGSATVTSGNKTINLGTAVTGMQAGMYIHVSGANNEFTARIAFVNATNQVEVEQTPTATFSGTATIYPIGILVGTRLENGTDVFNVPATASCLTIYQNRVVLGGVGYQGFSDTAKANKLQWSTLFTSGQDSPVTGCDGLVPFTKAGWPRRNYETLANLNKIVAVVPYGINQLIVFGDNGIAVISGDLGTVTADTSTSSYSVKYLSLDVGCVEARSIQETPYGIVFASRDGIYTTDGNTLTNILTGKLANEYSTAYADSVRVTSPTTLGGSALLDNRIYMFGIYGADRNPLGTLFIDLSNGAAITTTPRRMNGAKPITEQLWLYMSAKEPGSNRVYGIHNLPARNNYATITNLHDILNTEGSTNADIYDFYDTALPNVHTYVYATVQTKAYIESDPVLLKRFRHTSFQTIVKPAEQLGSGANNFLLVYYVLGSDGTTISSATKTVPPGWATQVFSPLLGNITRPASQTLAAADNAFTTRFDFHGISDAISYIITDQVSDGLPRPPSYTTTVPEERPPLLWELQEISIAHNALRRGRNFDGNYGTQQYTTFTFDTSTFNSNALFE